MREHFIETKQFISSIIDKNKFRYHTGKEKHYDK